MDTTRPRTDCGNHQASQISTWTPLSVRLLTPTLSSELLAHVGDSPRDSSELNGRVRLKRFAEIVLEDSSGEEPNHGTIPALISGDDVAERQLLGSVHVNGRHLKITDVQIFDKDVCGVFAVYARVRREPQLSIHNGDVRAASS